MRVRFMLLSIEQANVLPSRLVGVGTHIAHIFPSLRTSLKLAKLQTAPENYASASLVSAGIYGIVAGALFTFIGFLSQYAFLDMLYLGISMGVVFFLSAFALHLFYPRLLAQSSAGGIEQGLMFALRSLQIQVNSGVSLYDGMANVARSNYGDISQEFEMVVQEINAGVVDALKAVQTAQSG